jgi:acyl carrier protein
MGRLEEIIAKVFEIDISKIKKEMTPLDIEMWDSLSQLNLISSIEKEFQIKLEIDEIFTVTKIGDLYNLLSKKGVL